MDSLTLALEESSNSLCSRRTSWAGKRGWPVKYEAHRNGTHRSIGRLSCRTRTFKEDHHSYGTRPFRAPVFGQATSGLDAREGLLRWNALAASVMSSHSRWLPMLWNKEEILIHIPMQRIKNTRVAMCKAGTNYLGNNDGVPKVPLW